MAGHVPLLVNKRPNRKNSTTSVKIVKMFEARKRRRMLEVVPSRD